MANITPDLRSDFTLISDLKLILNQLMFDLSQHLYA